MRRNWLRELQSLVALGGIAAGFWVVLGLVLLSTRHVVCLDVVGVPATVTVPGLRDGAAPGSAVRICDDAPSWAQVWLDGLVALPAYALLAVGSILLWRLLRDVRRRDPFTVDAVRRLRRLAWLALGGGAAVTVVGTLAAAALAGSLVRDGLAADDPGFPWMWFGLGVGLGAVAEIVHRGVSLRDELDAVI